MNSLSFQIGTPVRLRNHPERRGKVVKIDGSGESVRVWVEFLDGNRNDFKPAYLESDTVEADPLSLLREGRTAPAHVLDLKLMLERLNGVSNLPVTAGTADTEFLAYQFKPLLRLLESPTRSLLVADEVGLGKTIEAGYIWNELRARDGAKRLLVVCPPKLREKWVRELKNRFGVQAALASATDLLGVLNDLPNNGSREAFCVCSYNQIRPPKDWLDTDARDPRSELARRLYEWNSPGNPAFDLVVIDEAHYMRNKATQAYELGELLCGCSGARVFLTATPIQTSADNLLSLMQLLDPDTFHHKQTFDWMRQSNQPLVRLVSELRNVGSKSADLLTLVREACAKQPFLEEGSVLSLLEKRLAACSDPIPDRERVELAAWAERANVFSAYFTRTRKRDVLDRSKRVLREPNTLAVDMSDAEREVYLTVQTEVAKFAEVADHPVGFLEVTPLRLVGSSVVAALQHWQAGQAAAVEDDDDDEEAPVADSLVATLRRRLAGRFDLDQLKRQDSKFAAFAGLLRAYWAEYPEQKLVVFTTFRPTARYLGERCRAEGWQTEVIMGGMGETADAAITRFRESKTSRLLISTEVGSEGHDMQFCSALINYDLPWNPMVVEQRIGRIDRIGQLHQKVLIHNLVHNGTMEARIWNRLFTRLQLIEGSIGDLEAILGERMKSLMQLALSHTLKDAEIERLIRETALAAEETKETLDQLEGASGELTSLPGSVVDRIRRYEAVMGWVESADLKRFVTDYLSQHATGTILNPVGPTEFDFELELDVDTATAFSAFVQSTSSLGQTTLQHGKRPVRFENRFSAAIPGRREKVSQAHPLVRFILHQMTAKRLVPAYAFALSTKPVAEVQVPQGHYLFLVHRWKSESMAPSADGSASNVELHVTMVSTRGEEIPSETAELMISYAARHGTEWQDWIDAISSEAAADALEQLGPLAEAAHKDHRELMEAEIRDRMNLRKQAIQNHLDRRSAQIKALISSGKMVAANQGRLRELQKSTEKKLKELEVASDLSHTEPELLAVGVLRIQER